MKNATDLFHKISYLQYPFMAVSIVYVLKPYFNNFQNVIAYYNIALVFLGIAIGFSSLQDTRKTQTSSPEKYGRTPLKENGY